VYLLITIIISLIGVKHPRAQKKTQNRLIIIKRENSLVFQVLISLNCVTLHYIDFQS
jgi:hypothetical protein